MTASEPRRALLDTSVLIDFPSAQVAAVADEVAVSAVTIGEPHVGVSAASDPLAQLRRRQRVQAILDRFDGLSFDPVTAESYGALATLVRQHGGNPWPTRLDLQIAATAAQHDLPLLTRDVGDFRGLESVVTVIDVPTPSVA